MAVVSLVYMTFMDECLLIGGGDIHGDVSILFHHCNIRR